MRGFHRGRYPLQSTAGTLVPTLRSTAVLTAGSVPEDRREVTLTGRAQDSRRFGPADAREAACQWLRRNGHWEGDSSTPPVHSGGSERIPLTLLASEQKCACRTRRAESMPDPESGKSVAEVVLAAVQVSREAQLQAAEALPRCFCHLSHQGSVNYAHQTS
jgi:hypothetical protein